MTSAELKQQAKESLKGRWGTAIAMVLVYQLILGGISLVANFIPFIGSIAVLIITVPISFGFAGQMLKFSRGEEVGLCDYFKIGFDNFGKSWSIVGYTFLKLLLPLITYVLSIIFMVTMSMVVAANSSEELIPIVLGIGALLVVFAIIFLIIKSYLYILTDYAGNDYIELDGKGSVQKSEDLMKGHRLEYFYLQLSFIGWALLATLTFGIGFIFLEPYMEVTNAKFYDNLAKNSVNNDKEIVTNN